MDNTSPDDADPTAPMPSDPGCLDVPGRNVIVVGNGAIGSALLAKLCAQPGVGRAFLLARDPGREDNRRGVTTLHLDAEQPETITAAATSIGRQVQQVHLLINTVGLLHARGQNPEKRLRDLRADHLQRAFTINATCLPLLAQAFARLLKHEEPAVLASLSARVGSIADNRLGGWYSYRASKAAHNMLLCTLAREWRVSHRNVSVVALHPGTVQSRLSAPFIGDNYRKRVLTPEHSADALLKVIAGLRPDCTGAFYDWQGHAVPW